MNFNRHEPAQHLSRRAQVPQTLPPPCTPAVYRTGDLYLRGKCQEVTAKS